MELVTAPPEHVADERSRPEDLVLLTTSAGQTRQVAAAMAGLCLPGDVLLLAGGLGAGKTTFAQGFDTSNLYNASSLSGSMLSIRTIGVSWKHWKAMS